jgi:uncharacterized protein with PQ loop repeat
MNYSLIKILNLFAYLSILYSFITSKSTQSIDFSYLAPNTISTHSYQQYYSEWLFY